MDPSGVVGVAEAGGNLPQYMIFAVLVIWLITNFVLKWRERNEEKHDPTYKVLAELSQSLKDTQERQLSLLNAINESLGRVAIQVREMHIAHLGDNARLPNGGLKWYNDPEVIRSLQDTMATLNNSIQSLNNNLQHQAGYIRQPSHGDRP